jgi:hypothetical protein
LPEGVRGKMEAALGADFSNVRVHVGPHADRIGAIAFTIGADIYFAPGRFQPDTVQGQQLLGHELAHVVQQRMGRVKNPLGSGLAVVQDHALEAEADRLGRQAAAHRVAAQAKRARSAHDGSIIFKHEVSGVRRLALPGAILSAPKAVRGTLPAWATASSRHAILRMQSDEDMYAEYLARQKTWGKPPPPDQKYEITEVARHPSGYIEILVYLKGRLIPLRPGIQNRVAARRGS